MQFPRDPGALLQHGPPGPLQLGALGLGGQRPLGAPPGTEAVHGDRPHREQDGRTDRAIQVRQVPHQPQPPGDEAQRPHPPQHRPPVADPGHAEQHQQHQHLRRAPWPAAPPLRGYQRGEQQREPPDPPAQQRIPGRQQQRRHHRHDQQHLPGAERRVVEVVTGAGAARRRRRGSDGGLRMDAGQVEPRTAPASSGSAPDRPGAATAGATTPGARPGRPAPGSARATPGAPPGRRCSPPVRGQASVSRCQRRPLAATAHHTCMVIPRYELARPPGPDYLRGMTANPAPWCDDRHRPSGQP